MRTLQLLRQDLARADIDEVARLAKVNVKTVKRILQSDIYHPRMNVAEKLSSALDCVELAPISAAKPAAIKARKKPAAQEA